MKLEEVKEWARYEYIQKCACGKEHKLLTQEDDHPEYHTEVYIACECGEYVEFNLPVN